MAPSYLSIAAAFLYLMVAGLAVRAGFFARANGQVRWHGAAWLLIAVFFAVLVASRLLAIEDLARETLRDTLRSSGAYAGRRDFQSILAAVILALVAGAGFALAYRSRMYFRGRRNLAVALSIAACAGMVFLIALRAVSLHSIDAVLYGPLKVNWLADIGLTFAILSASLYYVRRVKELPSGPARPVKERRLR